jgi:hypothetical protein
VLDWGVIAYKLTAKGLDIATLTFPQMANAIYEGRDPGPPKLGGKALRRILDDPRFREF